MSNHICPISPVDGSIICERSRPDDSAIERTLASATAAARHWRATPLDERREVLRRMVGLMVADAADGGRELTMQMGRPVSYAAKEILGGFKERADFLIDAAPAALADIRGAEKAGFELFIRREPLGVVLVVSPWNYPYLTAINAFLPALLAGNAVVLKHSDQTLLCAERLTAAFSAAGGPGGVFQHLHLDHAQVARVIADGRIGYVAFTGSVAGGLAVRAAASARFIATGMELGGKDPAYVRADADPEHAAAELVDGAFFNSGQSCCGIERIYVHRAVYQAFLEHAEKAVRGYLLGNPHDPDVTLGPVVRASAAAFVAAQVDEAVAAGARLVVAAGECSGHRPGTPYLGPQLLADCNHTMRLMREETFGPAVGVMAVDDDAEALRLMNDSDYGLTASIWTRDAAAAASMAAELESGTVFLNRCDYLEPSLAWTGVKNSGHGTTLSALGFEAFTRPKSYHFRLP